MRWRRLQFFFVVTLFFNATLPADPVAGQIYSFTAIDVDQNKLATADGHVTIFVMASSADVEKARLVGDRVPDYCLANPEYRMVTVVRFEKKHHTPMRAVINAVVRRRLDSEAQKLQTRYAAKKIVRNARSDVFALTDFDGTLGLQMGIPTSSTQFQVLVLGRNGQLLRRWTDVPAAEELAAVLK